MIDQQHLDTVFELHWLRVLTSSIPELSKWQVHISTLFREKASRLQLPVKPRTRQLRRSSRMRCSIFLAKWDNMRSSTIIDLQLLVETDLHSRRCWSFSAISSFIPMISKASKYLSLHSHNGIPNGLTSAVSTRLIGVHYSVQTPRHLDTVLPKSITQEGGLLPCRRPHVPRSRGSNT